VSLLQAFVLAVLQGATEFLPVSSSGHLVLAGKLIGVPKLDLAFVIFLHFGTLLAVVIYYRADLWAMVRSVATWKGEGAVQAADARHVLWLLIIGTIPAALIGWRLESYIDSAFSSLYVVGAALVVTGLVLAVVQRLDGPKEGRASRWYDAVAVGLAQAAAIIPGLSRSGMTICSGLAVGFSRQWAPRFAFLLSVPIILGGTAQKVRELVAASVPAAGLDCYLLGVVVAALSGIAAIHLVVRSVQRGNLLYFSVYCLAVGCLTLLAASNGWLQ